MSLDRRRAREVRQRALRMLRDTNLSAETRALYKLALDHAEVALGLDSARLRRQAASKPEPPLPSSS